MPGPLGDNRTPKSFKKQQARKVKRRYRKITEQKSGGGSNTTQPAAQKTRKASERITRSTLDVAAAAYRNTPQVPKPKPTKATKATQSAAKAVSRTGKAAGKGKPKIKKKEPKSGLDVVVDAVANSPTPGLSGVAQLARTKPGRKIVENAPRDAKDVVYGAIPSAIQLGKAGVWKSKVILGKEKPTSKNRTITKQERATGRRGRLTDGRKVWRDKDGSLKTKKTEREYRQQVGRSEGERAYNDAKAGLRGSLTGRTARLVVHATRVKPGTVAGAALGKSDDKKKLKVLESDVKGIGNQIVERPVSSALEVSPFGRGAGSIVSRAARVTTNAGRRARGKKPLTDRQFQARPKKREYRDNVTDKKPPKMKRREAAKQARKNRQEARERAGREGRGGDELIDTDTYSEGPIIRAAQKAADRAAPYITGRAERSAGKRRSNRRRKKRMGMTEAVGNVAASALEREAGEAAIKTATDFGLAKREKPNRFFRRSKKSEPVRDAAEIASMGADNPGRIGLMRGETVKQREEKVRQRGKLDAQRRRKDISKEDKKETERDIERLDVEIGQLDATLKKIDRAERGVKMDGEVPARGFGRIMPKRVLGSSTAKRRLQDERDDDYVAEGMAPQGKEGLDAARAKAGFQRLGITEGGKRIGLVPKKRGEQKTEQAVDREQEVRAASDEARGTERQPEKKVREKAATPPSWKARAQARRRLSEEAVRKEFHDLDRQFTGEEAKRERKALEREAERKLDAEDVENMARTVDWQMRKLAEEKVDAELNKGRDRTEITREEREQRIRDAYENLSDTEIQTASARAAETWKQTAPERAKSGGGTATKVKKATPKQTARKPVDREVFREPVRDPEAEQARREQNKEEAQLREQAESDAYAATRDLDAWDRMDAKALQAHADAHPNSLLAVAWRARIAQKDGRQLSPYEQVALRWAETHKPSAKRAEEKRSEQLQQPYGAGERLRDAQDAHLEIQRNGPRTGTRANSQKQKTAEVKRKDTPAVAKAKAALRDAERQLTRLRAAGEADGNKFRAALALREKMKKQVAYQEAKAAIDDGSATAKQRELVRETLEELLERTENPKLIAAIRRELIGVDGGEARARIKQARESSRTEADAGRKIGEALLEFDRQLIARRQAEAARKPADVDERRVIEATPDDTAKALDDPEAAAEAVDDYLTLGEIDDGPLVFSDHSYVPVRLRGKRVADHWEEMVKELGWEDNLPIYVKSMREGEPGNAGARALELGSDPTYEALLWTSHGDILRTLAEAPREIGIEWVRRAIVWQFGVHIMPDGSLQLGQPGRGRLEPMSREQGDAIIKNAPKDLDWLPASERGGEANGYVVPKAIKERWDQRYNDVYKIKVAPGREIDVSRAINSDVAELLRAGSRTAVRVMLPFKLGWHLFNSAGAMIRYAILADRHVFDPVASRRISKSFRDKINAEVEAGNITRQDGAVILAAWGRVHVGDVVRTQRYERAQYNREQGGRMIKAGQAAMDWMESRPAAGVPIRAYKEAVGKALDASGKMESAMLSGLRVQGLVKAAEEMGWRRRQLRDLHEIEELAELAIKDPVAMARIHQLQLELMGDYITRSPWMGVVSSGPVPFINWLRESAKFVAYTAPKNSPIRFGFIVLAAQLTEEERAKLGLNYLVTNEQADALMLPRPDPSLWSAASIPIGDKRVSLAGASEVLAVADFAFGGWEGPTRNVAPSISRGIINWVDPDSKELQRAGLFSSKRLNKLAEDTIRGNVPLGPQILGALDPAGMKGQGPISKYPTNAREPSLLERAAGAAGAPSVDAFRMDDTRGKTKGGTEARARLVKRIARENEGISVREQLRLMQQGEPLPWKDEWLAITAESGAPAATAKTERGARKPRLKKKEKSLEEAWPVKMLALGGADLPGLREGIATVYFPSQGGINGNEGAGAYATVFEKGWGVARLGTAGGGVRNAWGLTVVKVTNKANGRSVLAPVIDNGPGAGPIGGKPRILDLLPPVARALSSSGSAENLEVSIEPVGRISERDASRFGRGELSGSVGKSGAADRAARQAKGSINKGTRKYGAGILELIHDPYMGSTSMWKSTNGGKSVIVVPGPGDHSDHVHIAMATRPALMKIKKEAQRFNLRVTSDNEGYSGDGVHASNSNHYAGLALDLGGSAEDMKRFTAHIAKTYGLTGQQANLDYSGGVVSGGSTGSGGAAAVSGGGGNAAGGDASGSASSDTDETSIGVDAIFDLLEGGDIVDFARKSRRVRRRRT